jgi:hypothetical protein
MRMALIAVAVVGCSTSSGPPTHTTVSTTPDEPKAAVAEVGVAFDRVGELGACEPAGKWRAVGTWRGVGNCPAAMDPVVLDLEVVRGRDGYRLVPPAGADGRGDSLATSGGACALSLELHFQLDGQLDGQLGDRDRPNIILFADLVEGGKGAATWDEYEPTPAGVVFSPDQGTIRCSDALDLAVEAVERSAAAPEVRNEHH